MTDPSIKLVRHDNILDCMAAYFECSVPELKTLKGDWTWMDEDGQIHSKPMKAALTTLVIERKVWGWLDDRRVLNIWVSEKAEPWQVLRVMAHELGHCLKPFYKNNLREEKKAAKYAKVATKAFVLMEELMGG